MSDNIRRSAQEEVLPVPRPNLRRSPVNTLPVELLGYIFILAAASTDPNDDYDRDPNWIKYTHVCRTWHQAAILNGVLWTNISVPKYTLPEVELYLENSRNASLNISISDDISTYRGARWEHGHSIDKVFEQLRRIKALTFVGSSPIVWHHWQTIIRTGATALKELILENKSNECLQVPNDLFGEHDPPLQQLTLANFTASPTWPALSRLRTLVINWGSALENPQLELRGMLDTLESCQSLEELGICLGRDWELPSNERRVINLPRLKNVKFSGDARSYLELLYGISINIVLPDGASQIAVVAALNDTSNLISYVYPLAQQRASPLMQIEFDFEHNGAMFPYDVQTSSLAVALDAWFPRTATLEFYLPYTDTTADICGETWSDLFDKVPNLRSLTYGAKFWEEGDPLRILNVELVEAIAGLYSYELEEAINNGNGIPLEDIEQKCRRLKVMSFERLDFTNSNFVRSLTKIKPYETRSRSSKRTIQFKQCIGLSEEHLELLRRNAEVIVV